MDLHSVASTPIRRYWREPFNAISHFVGFLLALVGMAALLEPTTPGTARAVALQIYGGSLATLFLASSAYHFLDLGARGNRWLRRLDHATIFLLIAGTYTPFLVVSLEGAARIATLAVVGGLAVAGVVFKLTWFSAPRWLDTALYLGLGWFIVFAGPVIVPALGGEQLLWLGLGGAAYTVGALIYGLKRPDPWPGTLGFHGIWHLFVLLGAGAHFMGVYSLLKVPVAPF